MDSLMTALIHLIVAHQTASALIAMWLGSNVVSAMPSPSQSSNGFYKFIFSLAHGLAGSLPRLLPNLRLPGDTTRGAQSFFGRPDINAIDTPAANGTVPGQQASKGPQS
jgi:hypothetical protein